MLDAPDVYDSRFGNTYKELNPEAAPFIPSVQLSQPSRLPLSPIIQARVLAASGASALPSPPTPDLKPIASWVTIFHAASITPPTNPLILAERAVELAHSTFWRPAVLAELAQHFCWKASAANSDVDRESLAPFAWEGYRALWDAYDEDTANSFVWHLRESLIGTFKGCWCTTESTRAISYRFAPSEEYVASATWLTAFIGSLFTFDLIRVQHIKMCLSILVHELCSLEHITAISVLIKYAGPNLWCYPDGVALPIPVITDDPSSEMIHLFLDSFLPKTAKLGNGNSVLARTVEAGTAEKDEKLQEVINILAQWCPDLTFV
jgi:hypothetical protein